MKQLKALFCLYVFLVTASTSSAAISCQKLFSGPRVLELNYGVISQDDVLLRDNGLFSAHGKSMLCVPTCLYNIREKLRVDTGQKNTLNSNPNDLVAIVNDLKKYSLFDNENGTSSIFIPSAVYIFFQHENFEVTYTEKMSFQKNKNNEIKIEEIKSSVGSRVGILAGISRHSTSNWEDANRSNLASSHVLVVNGYDTENANRLFFR